MKSIANKMANLINADLDAISVVKKTWSQQFHEAMNVNGGDIANASTGDYVAHFIAFPWKVLFAFLPPPHILGGWLCFCCSLFVIGILTAIVGDAAAIFGCLVGLKDSVTAITYDTNYTYSTFTVKAHETQLLIAISQICGSGNVAARHVRLAIRRSKREDSR